MFISLGSLERDFEKDVRLVGVDFTHTQVPKKEKLFQRNSALQHHNQTPIQANQMDKEQDILLPRWQMTGEEEGAGQDVFSLFFGK